MSPLAPFVAWFLAVSAVASIVNAMVQEDRPGKIAAHAALFFLWFVVGILDFSVVVYFLGIMNYPVALAILLGSLALLFAPRLFTDKSR